MFTIEQIKAAHSKVKGGADFPQYVKDIIELGVTCYETYVADGHTDYYGKDDYKISSEKKYNKLDIASESNITKFENGLKEHQQGKTDYITFCRMCAATGVKKWVVSMTKMTCTYYNKAGNEMLREVIPNVKKIVEEKHF